MINMRNLFFALLFVFAFVSNSNAQSSTFKNLRVDFGTLYAVPGGDVVDAGVGFYINPKYHLTDKMLVGLRYEGAVLSAVESSMSISMISSVGLSFDYYLNANAFRPYVGVDAGSYSLGSMDFKADAGAGVAVDGSIKIGSKIGIAPKLGFTYKHFDLGLQYNLILGSEDVIDPSDFNYLSFKLGFHFGGGRR